MNMRDWLQSFTEDQQGLTTVEYALLLSAIAVGLAVTWQALGDSMVGVVDDTNEALAPTQSGIGCQ